MSYDAGPYGLSILQWDLFAWREPVEKVSCTFQVQVVKGQTISPETHGSIKVTNKWADMFTKTKSTAR